MAVDAAPSRKAPPRRLRLGASAMDLATAYPVAARGSRPHSASAGSTPSRREGNGSRGDLGD